MRETGICAPIGIAINEHTGDVYVSELNRHTIKKISHKGMSLCKQTLFSLFSTISRTSNHNCRMWKRWICRWTTPKCNVL